MLHTLIVRTTQMVVPDLRLRLGSPTYRVLAEAKWGEGCRVLSWQLFTVRLQKGLGFRVLGFRVLGFRVWGLGF